MKRQKNQTIWKAIHAQPLSNWWDALRNDITVEPMDDPLNPIMSVTDKIMTVRNAVSTGRNIYLLPLMLAWWFVAGALVNDFYSSLYESESYANYSVKLEREASGLDHLELMKEERYAQNYALIKENRKINALDYLRYQHEFKDPVSFWGEVTFFLVFFIAAIWSSISYIRLPRHAEFHFDRELRIVYRWENDKVFGCSFENLGFVETKIGLMLFVYGENPDTKKGGYTPVRSVVQPTEKDYFFKDNDINGHFMAQLVAYMDHGKQAIITGEYFYRKPAFFFFEDKKPKDFDIRLNQVLAKEHELVQIYADNAEK